MYSNIVKGNQTANSKVYQEIIKDFPHVDKIISKLYISTDYAIGNIRDNDNRIVFYFYQSKIFYNLFLVVFLAISMLLNYLEN